MHPQLSSDSCIPSGLVAPLPQSDPRVPSPRPPFSHPPNPRPYGLAPIHAAPSAPFSRPVPCWSGRTNWGECGMSLRQAPLPWYPTGERVRRQPVVLSPLALGVVGSAFDGWLYHSVSTVGVADWAVD